MTWRFLTSVLAIVVLLAGCAAAVAEEKITPEQEKLFEEKIRPILAGRCFKCHGKEKQESELRLDSRARLLQGGATGEKNVVPGEPETSLLIRALRYDGDLQMPPDAKLSEEQIGHFVTWVKQGAPWPNSAAEEQPMSAAQRSQHDRATHWAFQPVSRPVAKLPAGNSPAQTSLDLLIAEQLASKQLTFSPAADKRTLVRRVYFDLLGLPPTADEVDSFVDNPAPDAYESLVDRLLASPHYGERWGRHWLDVARYADTRGYAFTNDRRYPYAYTYRDYVVAAFNRDLPFDQFVREQLAADKLPLGDDKQALAAMGFLTVGRKYNNAQDDVDDQIDVVTRGLLGLTVTCARCHDHKFDAIPAEDYYSLYGVFASSKQPDELPIIGPPRGNVNLEEFNQELEKRKAELAKVRGELHADITHKAREKAVDYLVRVANGSADTTLARMFGLSLGPDDLKPKLVDRWKKYFEKHAKPEHATLGLWHDLTRLSREKFAEEVQPILERFGQLPQGLESGQLNPTVKSVFAETPPNSHAAVGNLYGKLFASAYAEWKKAGGNAEAFDKLPPEVRKLAEIIVGPDSPTAIPMDDLNGYLNRAESNKLSELRKKVETYTATSAAAPPRAMVLQENPQPHNPQVLIRGNPARPGKGVPRQFLTVVAGPERKPFPNGSGRLDLANAIVAGNNPLTPRVFVNRLWMHHFGEPLVTTPSDFGVRTERPVLHTALEWLTAEFVQPTGTSAPWSMKNLHRQLMISHVYRQDSVDRPAARQIDPENRLLWKMNRRRLEFEAQRDALLAVSGELDLTVGGRGVDLFKTPYPLRRAVYGTIDRQDLPNTFRVFDLASPDQSTPRRPQTTVPQQALFFMNSPFLVERAKSLAGHPQVTVSDDPVVRISALYRLILARSPEESELSLAREFVAASEAGMTGNKLNSWQQFAQLLLLTNEFVYVD